MENQTKKVFTLLGVMLILSAGAFISYSKMMEERNAPLKDRNYVAEVKLGVAPNMQSRQPTDKDFDTKINLQTGDGRVFRLVESKDFLTYGKTFVVPLN